MRGLWVTVFILFTVISCTIQPPLHLPDDDPEVNVDIPQIELDLDLLWDYKFVIDSITGEIYDSTYNWRDEFFYGWDDYDDKIFGTWYLVQPELFNVRRYYTFDTPKGAHTQVNEHTVEGNTLSNATWQFGYYDILAWNEVETLDGVQSLHIDETTTLDYVHAYTNASMARSRYNIKRQYAYYQPEFLFGGYAQGVYISRDPKDYDYYDEERRLYYKKIDLNMLPRTYIYLTQIVLRNNRGRITEIENTGSMQGMSIGTNVNTGVTDDDEIAVTYKQRLKQGVWYRNGELVDIIGGRLFTFGLCGMNPSRATRATANDSIRNYIDVNMTFSNGNDSTFVFDVTNQVRKRFKGGIITIELDMDTIPAPSRPGGSGFDAVVEDYDRREYEFDM